MEFSVKLSDYDFLKSLVNCTFTNKKFPVMFCKRWLLALIFWFHLENYIVHNNNVVFCHTEIFFHFILLCKLHSIKLSVIHVLILLGISFLLAFYLCVLMKIGNQILILLLFPSCLFIFLLNFRTSQEETYNSCSFRVEFKVYITKGSL